MSMVYVMSMFEIFTRPELAAFTPMGMLTVPSPFSGTWSLNCTHQRGCLLHDHAHR